MAEVWRRPAAHGDHGMIGKHPSAGAAPPKAAAVLDIAANRRARKWSRLELLGRLAWELAYPVFRLTPRFLWGSRRLMLRCFGARIGSDVHIYPNVKITIPWNLEIGDFSAVGDGATLYSLGRISIGPQVTISQGAHLCAGTHDYRKADFPLVKRPIAVGAGAWVCADAFVGPGVSVGDHAIVAARAVLVRDAPAWAIVGGNPAKVVGPRRPPKA